MCLPADLIGCRAYETTEQFFPFKKKQQRMRKAM